MMIDVVVTHIQSNYTIGVEVYVYNNIALF